VFDKDGSGNIDANELRSVLNSLGLGDTDDEFNSLMKSMDRNNDGTISFVGK
jgi:Ca2+-binding EF-hand superfamily protein